ncbi:MAG: hypothetical protein JNM94_06700 [Phycisphaerae bacterium]|nr:hypothetical protein [Phycisphaerae bacterium]
MRRPNSVILIAAVTAPLTALLATSPAAGADSVTLLDRLTPASGAPNALVNGRWPIAVNSVPFEGYAGTVEFSVEGAPTDSVTLSSLQVAYAGLPGAAPTTWTLRVMLWSSFDAAIVGLPGSTTAMYNGDIATLIIPGTQVSFEPFGTHIFNGPIFLATIDLSPYDLTLAAGGTYVLGCTVFNAGDAGVMETAQLGPPDRGLSPYYRETGWRYMNVFDDLEIGRYAIRLTATTTASPPCPADLNGSGTVDAADLGILLGAWGACGSCAADLDQSGTVDAADLGVLLGAWGVCS